MPGTAASAAAAVSPESGGLDAVRRSVLIIRGQQVDCAAPGAACGWVRPSCPTSRTPRSSFPSASFPRPVLRGPICIHKRRDTQQLFYDNQYFPSVSDAPQRSHAIVPGGTWTFALIVQNDGDITDDLILSAPNVPTPPLAVRFYVGYFDVTAAVTGSGFTFHDFAPGQLFVFAVQFRADVEHPRGYGCARLAQADFGTAPELVDFARTWVGVTISA